MSRKTRFIIYGLSRINRIINDLVVFNLGPKIRNGTNKRFGFFSIHFFLELALTLAMISKTQLKSWSIEKKMSINFVEDKSIHKHNFLFENNYCISLCLHVFCLQISVDLM